MSKRYDVFLPITGVVHLSVEAESEEDAIQKALMSEDLTSDKIESWNAVEHIVTGNVFHGELNSAEAELAFGEEEK